MHITLSPDEQSLIQKAKQSTQPQAANAIEVVWSATQVEAVVAYLLAYKEDILRQKSTCHNADTLRYYSDQLAETDKMLTKIQHS